MYHDIVDVIKNLQTLTINDSAFRILKDFERVIDELDVYVFKNWQDGELLAGPDVGRYTVTCKFMWPKNHMPDPSGGERLLDYGCKIFFEKKHILIPRKIKTPGDFRPGTKKGKLDAHPIWVVTIIMPKKLMQDIYQGYETNTTEAMANMMQDEQPTAINQAMNAVPTDVAANTQTTPEMYNNEQT
jgi:hypothetical protein